MAEVVVTDEFAEWFDGLRREDGDASTAIEDAVNVLEISGPTLGHPRSSAIRGSPHALRELRVQSKERPFRILYAFDPRRQAVLLIGGDKTGDDRFYEKMIPVAEKIWEQYLAEQKAGLHDEED